MAVDFGEGNTTSYYTATDDAALTIPSGEFAICFWAHLDDNAGTAYQYLISTGGYGATPSLNIFWQEDDVGDAADGTLNAFLVDDAAAGPGQMISTTTDFVTGGELWFFVFQRTGSQYELWSCARGSGDATLEDTGTLGSPSTSNGGAWNIGRRSDGESARYFEEHAGEIAFFSGTSFSEVQIEAMAEGEQTYTEIGHSPDAYWSMNTAADTADDSGNGHDLSSNGSPSDSGFQFIVAASAIDDDLVVDVSLDAVEDILQNVVD